MSEGSEATDFTTLYRRVGGMAVATLVHSHMQNFWLWRYETVMSFDYQCGALLATSVC